MTTSRSSLLSVAFTTSVTITTFCLNRNHSFRFSLSKRHQFGPHKITSSSLHDKPLSTFSYILQKVVVIEKKISVYMDKLIIIGYKMS